MAGPFGNITLAHAPFPVSVELTLDMIRFTFYFTIQVTGSDGN